MGKYLVKQKRGSTIVYLVEADSKQDALENLVEYSRIANMEPSKLTCSDEINEEITEVEESDEGINDILL